MPELPTSYRSSDGRDTPIADMATRHIGNALTKLGREGADMTPVALALRTELARRQMADPRQQAEAPGPREAVIGDNEPPSILSDDATFQATLEAGGAELAAANADHELAKLALPANPSSDADVAAITAWCVKARALAASAEKHHQAAKAPWLKRGRQVDTFYFSIRDALREDARVIEQRSAPYLLAKRREAEAEAARVAAAARAAQAERDRVAAEEAQAAEEARVRKEEAEQRLALAQTQEAARAAAQDLQTATRDEMTSADAANQAEADAAKLGRAAEHIEQAAAGPLERTVAGGGAASLTTTIEPEIVDRDACRASLGPWAGLFTGAEVDAALARAAKEKPLRVLPGVRFHERTGVATRAARS